MFVYIIIIITIIRRRKTQRAVEFIKEKGASSWLSVIPLKEINFTLNKREFRDAIKLRYGWEFNDIPTVCVSGDLFDADHAMICMRGSYIIQRHNEIRDLEAEILQAVCTDVEMEPVVQEVTVEVLPRGANKAPDARLDIRVRSFRAREQSAFFDVRVSHSNADSYKNLTSEQIYKLHENDKKRLNSSRVLEVERGTFAHLVFTTMEACLMNVNVTTVVSLSYWQSRNTRVTLPLSHGLGLESLLPS